MPSYMNIYEIDFHSNSMTFRRLLDVLLALQESNHLPSQLAIELNSPPPEDVSLLDNNVWNDDVKHLARLYSETYENTSDEEAEPPARNPMSLIEWLRRNQPSVFTTETLEPKKTVAEKAMAGQKSGAGHSGGGGGSGGAAGAGGAGAGDGNSERTPTKKRKAPADPSSVSRSSRKRKAPATAAVQQEDNTDGSTATAASAQTDSPAVGPSKSKRVKREE